MSAEEGGVLFKNFGPNLGAALLFALLLAGCCTPPDPIVTTVEVPVPCRVATPERPVMPLDDPGSYTRADGDISLDRFAAAALASNYLWEGYTGQLTAALATCKHDL